MKQGYYTSGEFARKANVTIRTIRFYDKQGILKPSRISESGYRLYTDEDFGRLQKILCLKYLGFSLEDIVSMTINDDVDDIAHSLCLQRELIDKRIRHLQMMEQTLEETAEMASRSGTIDWNNILNLIHMTNMEYAIVDQYKTAVNLSVRIGLHKRFSHNPKPWFQWLAEQLPLSEANHILEVGCGNGELWQYVQPQQISGKEVWLTDISPGMVEDAQQALSEKGKPGEQFHFSVEDGECLPFAQAAFDLAVANHVLFYVKDRKKALEEIRRVLKPGGWFFCSTYGKDHMKEITSLVREFDPRITLSDVALYELFGLENGREQLLQVFSQAEPVLYEDYLLVDEAEPLFDYILSCHGNQSEILSKRQLEFKAFLQKKIREQGGIRITKMAGVFVCR